MAKTTVSKSSSLSLAASAVLAAAGTAQAAEALAAPAGPDTPAARKGPLQIGAAVQVVCAAGVVLRNNESGGFFEPEVPTPQTVTVTLLRRLADGDLTLV